MNANLVNTLRTMTKSSFAMSLVSQADRGRVLSPKQVAAAEAMIARANTTTTTAGNAAMQEALTGRKYFPRIKAMLDTASASGLKSPKIRFVTEAGVKVVVSLAGPNSANAGFVYVTDGGPFGANAYFGKIDLGGSFTAGRDCTADIIAVLDTVEANPEAAAQAYGRKTGSCCFCGRHLTDGVSVERGYGPICADKHGLDHSPVARYEELEVAPRGSEFLDT